MIDENLLRRIVEAALLASPQPLSMSQMLALFEESESPGHGNVARVLESIAADCDGRGIELVEVASGWRFQVRNDVFPWVGRLWAERPPRYSRALLETLALIAYRQPITRAEIEQIRGVAVSTHIVRTLEEREWIRVVGHRDVPGRPALYGTSKEFLDYFKLRSLDQLPALSDLRDIDDLDPQLLLEPVAITGDVDVGLVASTTTTADSLEATSADPMASDSPGETGAAAIEPEPEAFTNGDTNDTPDSQDTVRP